MNSHAEVGARVGNAERGVRAYSARDSGGEERPNRPTREVQTKGEGTDVGRGGLANVAAGRGLGHADAHADKDAANDEHAGVLGRSAYDGAKDIQQGRQEDAHLAPLPVNELAGDRSNDDGAGEGGAGHDALRASRYVEVLVVAGHDVERAHERAIVGDGDRVNDAD